MEIAFNLTGTYCKRLVAAMTEIVNAPMRYMGAPTFGFEVGGYVIDRVGTVISGENISHSELAELLAQLRERGFEAEMPTELAETDAPQEPVKPESDAPVESLPETDEPDEPQEADKLEPDEPTEALILEFPRDGMTAMALENLRKLIDSKATLIKNALGADSLTVETTGETLRFPWFSRIPSPDEIYAYSLFISKLIDMAKAQTRVTAGQRDVENEKYAFRCFLLRLGFIGAEYKDSRRILLKNFSGSSAFKSGAKAENANESGGNENE